MAEKSRYQVSLKELEAVHVPAEEQIEGLDPTPPNPDVKPEDERRREQVIRGGGGI